MADETAEMPAPTELGAEVATEQVPTLEALAADQASDVPENTADGPLVEVPESLLADSDSPVFADAAAEHALTTCPVCAHRFVPGAPRL